MQSIRIEVPEDRAIVHVTAGAVLQVDGRRSEAEAEYHAFRALEEAGHSESADVGAIFHCLGSLYLAEHRLDEAWGALDRALAIYYYRAKDAVPADRMKLLDLRRVLYARLGEWKRSE